MDIYFDKHLASGYKSTTQKIRVLTESWVQNSLYCPRCGSARIGHFPNNRAVADFYCAKCGSEYELKSKGGRIQRKITDGAYETFISRIKSNNNPDFLIMSYDAAELCVNDLWFVPKHFFVPEIVEKRKPLSDTARRAGWIGCNILFDRIPEQGRIPIVSRRLPAEKGTVLREIRRSERLNTDSIAARGWMMEVLRGVNGITGDEFSLADIYRIEAELARIYPGNHNVRAKIRQQLQVLRDRGYLEFLGGGRYRKTQGQNCI